MLRPNPEIELIVEKASEFAAKYGHSYVTVEHLSLALINYKNFRIMLEEFGADWQGLNDAFVKYLTENQFGKKAEDGAEVRLLRTHALERVFNRAYTQVLFGGREHMQTIDIFLSIYAEEKGYSIYLFKKFGVIKQELVEFFNQTYVHENPYTSGELGKEEAERTLTEYCTDLNKLAEKGQVDPVIGRQKEIDELCQILGKRNKSNVLLVGDPGVGKTAIAEGLAGKIVAGEVPHYLKEATIYSLDIGSLVAGSKYRGEFEEKIKDVFDSLQAKPGSIVFIDEAHTMRGAGATSGSGPDFAQMVKPYITKGLRVIASTTWEEYNTSFEKDRALMRRFYRLTIDEPTPAVAKDILVGLKKYFEEYHTAKITKNAIESAVDLSVRYQTDKRLPDKAIDLIDSACAKQRLLNRSNFTINKPNILEELSKAVKIPVDQLGSASSGVKVEENLETIEGKIKTGLYGQDKAVDTIMDRVIVTRAGLKSHSKPIGSYLLVGPTGTGKTELAKLLSENLHMKLLRFDMGEYQEKHTVARLIGAPPGYVGYEDGNLGGGLLVSQVEKDPNAIILFDEIEKAHPDVTNVLLSLMDEGFVTSTNGKKADARNCIVLMTSNLGAKESEKRGIGFGASEENTEASTEEVKKFFAPEFRNRLDGTIKFNKLDNTIMRKIVIKFIDEINELMLEKGLHITISESAVEQLAKKGYDPSMGARPLKRVIENEIKIPLSKSIIKDKPIAGTKIILKFEDDKFTFDYKPEEVIVDKLATNPGVDEDGLIVLDQFKPKVR
jgi:ATP-dependent Clp protease ATP-binding subunit ClpA